MKISVRAAGLIKSGPERTQIDDYLKRANGLARPVGISEISESAVDTRRAKSSDDETNMILSTIATGDVLVILDETGQEFSSRQLSQKVAAWRDDGQKHLVFAIGGADGFDPNSLPTNTIKWRLGRQTWPHKLVRVMICEQIYRALSILAGTPYHRE